MTNTELFTTILYEALPLPVAHLIMTETIKLAKPAGGLERYLELQVLVAEQIMEGEYD